MQDIFTKYYWDEEGILFYVHFRDNYAVRQIEISDKGTVYLSEDNPIQGDDMLYDQTFEDSDINDDQIISQEEFEGLWRKQSS